jgi:UDP-glucose 4-epimerase
MWFTLGKLPKSESSFEGKKVLITGGLGFIGSNLARKLVELGAKITIVDSLIPEYGGNLFNISNIRKQVKVNLSDIRDRHSLRFMVEGQDYIFNLAGQTSHVDSMLDPFTDLDINTQSQLSLLETCRKYNSTVKLVFASTRQIYGRPQYLPVDEKHPIVPVDVNGINKWAGEQYHLLYNNVYGIRACVLRLTNTYGINMRIKDARQTFLGIWVKLLLEGKPFEIWEGHHLRDFNYVDDVVEAFILAAEQERSNGKIYNLGGNETISLTDLGKLLIEIYGEGEFIAKEYPPERKLIDIGDYYSDYRKITEDLGWIPKVSLRQGLKLTLDYYNYKLYRDHYLEEKP